MTSLFFLKKTLAPLLFPFSIVLIFLILGGILLLVSRKRLTGSLFLVPGILLFVAFTSGPTAQSLLLPLETRSPPLTLQEAGRSLRGQSRPWIVVLGGGHYDHPPAPALHRLSPESLIRLMEGMRLQRGLPGSRLLLSGGAVWGKTTDADAMAQAARELGASPGEISLETASLDTEAQAKAIRPFVGLRPFILVTSASHMPRSLAIFHRNGLSPLPAPAGALTHPGEKTTPRDFFPAARHALMAETAFYEYLGLIWGKISGIL